MLQSLCVDVELKRLNHHLLWIKPSSDAELQRLVHVNHDFSGTPLQWLDRWTEVLGPNLRPQWLQLDGIPLHAWSEEFFHSIGECFGPVVKIDNEARSRRWVDVA